MAVLDEGDPESVPGGGEGRTHAGATAPDDYKVVVSCVFHGYSLREEGFPEREDGFDRILGGGIGKGQEHGVEPGVETREVMDPEFVRPFIKKEVVALFPVPLRSAAAVNMGTLLSVKGERKGAGRGGVAPAGGPVAGPDKNVICSGPGSLEPGEGVVHGLPESMGKQDGAADEVQELAVRRPTAPAFHRRAGEKYRICFRVSMWHIQRYHPGRRIQNIFDKHERNALTS